MDAPVVTEDVGVGTVLARLTCPSRLYRIGQTRTRNKEKRDDRQRPDYCTDISDCHFSAILNECLPLIVATT